MSDKKSTGVEEPKWLNPDPEFQYLTFRCDVCGDIWIKYPYARGSDFKSHFLKFICCEKQTRIPYIEGITEKPLGKIVIADISS